MTHTNRYNRRNVETMEMLHATGYLSMGGDDEVARIVAQVEVAGKDVLDIGCGLGGALIALTRNHHARYAHGTDIDAGVPERRTCIVPVFRSTRSTISSRIASFYQRLMRRYLVIVHLSFSGKWIRTDG